MLLPMQVLEEPENALPGPSRLENEEKLQNPVTQEDKWHPDRLVTPLSMSKIHLVILLGFSPASCSTWFHEATARIYLYLGDFRCG